MKKVTVRRRKSTYVLSALLIGLLGLAAWINLPLVMHLFDGSADRVAALPVAPVFQKGQKVLLLSPHPDDETLCCAGILQQAKASGAQVYVAWTTAGDGFEFDAVLTQRVLDPSYKNMRDLGQTRTAEAQQAALVLGIPTNHTFMLGYPDGGLFNLFTTNYDDPFTAKHTGASKVYVQGSLTPGAEFTGHNLENDIRTVLNKVNPDIVLAPAPQDFHPDHHTLSFIALRLMSQRQQESRLRYWVVHGALEWPIPKGLHENLPLTIPPRANRLPWQKVPLSPAEEQVKLKAVNSYHTQTRIMGRFMRAFVRQNELLSPEPLPESPATATER